MGVDPRALAHIIDINRRRIGLDTADTEADRRFSAASGAETQLCIYGRMRPGGPDAHVLEPLGGTWAEATFPGYLQGGACTLDECPGLAWSPDGEWNDGFILTTDKLATFWEYLDAKEGENLTRLLTPVHSGEQYLVANIYVSRDASEAQLLMLDGMNVHDDVDFRL